MNLVVLRTFLTILETGSLAQASRHLNVTQSTVTTRLQTLEDSLGQTLLLRDKSGLVLTAAGAKFQRYAETMTALWQQALQETGLPDGVGLVCNLGCEPDFWPLYGVRFVRLLKQEVPDVALNLVSGDAAQLEDWLNAGLIDLAICTSDAERSGQKLYQLDTEKLIVVSTQKDGPTRSDPNYVFVEFGEVFARWHTRLYADAGTAKVSFGSALWAREFLLEHGGSAYLPEGLVQGDIRAGNLFHLEQAPSFERKVTLAGVLERVGSWDWIEDLVDGFVA